MALYLTRYLNVPPAIPGEGDEQLDDLPADVETILIAVARYLAAHSPTERAALQTADIARRLMRGGELHQRVHPRDETQSPSLGPASMRARFLPMVSSGQAKKS